MFALLYLAIFDGLAISDNVPSVSEVPRRGIWAKVRSTEARYALLGDVRLRPLIDFPLLLLYRNRNALQDKWNLHLCDTSIANLRIPSRYLQKVI